MLLDSIAAHHDNYIDSFEGEDADDDQYLLDEIEKWE